MPNLLVRDVPERLHEILERSARRNRWSLEREILTRLEGSAAPVRLDATAVVRRLAPAVRADRREEP